LSDGFFWFVCPDLYINNLLARKLAQIADIVGEELAGLWEKNTARGEKPPEE
jgi:hypothetical protein